MPRFHPDSSDSDSTNSDYFIPDTLVTIIDPTSEYFVQTNGSDMIWETMFVNLRNKDKGAFEQEQTLSAQERFHLQFNGANKQINNSNIVTPKFLKQLDCESGNSTSRSINRNVCKITVICKSQAQSSTASYIGSGIIILNLKRDTLVTSCMALTSAHVLYPPDVADLDIVEIVASSTNFVGHKCKIVETGNYVNTKKAEDDWALLQIEGEFETWGENYYDPIIPSPSAARTLTNVDEDGYPSIYTLFLFGYFVKNEIMDEREKQRLIESQFDLLDIFKLIPQEQMSGSLGWSTNTSLGTIEHCCGTTGCCSGGPLFKCRMNVNEILEIDKSKTSWQQSLFEKAYVSNKLVGIHCGGALKGNRACSAINFFESYYIYVYKQFKNNFSKEEQLFIEMEWESELEIKQSGIEQKVVI